MALDVQSLTNTHPVADATSAHARGAAVAQDAAAAPRAKDAQQAGRSGTLSLAAAQASISAGQNLVAHFVVSPTGTVSAIRVVDPTTGQVIAENPPDSIARMQQEIATYQKMAQASRSE